MHLPLFFSVALSCLHALVVPSLLPLLSVLIADLIGTRFLLNTFSSIVIALNIIPTLPNEVHSNVIPAVKATMVFLMMSAYNFFSALNMLLIATSLPKVTIKLIIYRRVPGWNNAARTLHQTAVFWHKVWSECGVTLHQAY